jgi:RHS repeat-associated protein
MIYDARNRLQEVDFHRSDAGLESSIVYTYDLADRLTQVVDSLAGTITRSYDGRDNLLTETTPLGNVTYTYDLAGRRTSMTIGGQPEVTYGYDAANRLTTITKGTDVITLGYDNANRRTSMAMADGISVAYGYDNDNRLTSVTYTSGTNTVETLAYGYDAAGHLIAKGGTLATVSLPAPVTSATYNADNQLTLWGSQGFTYDFNGNLTSDGTMTYQWNTRNQLISLDGGAIAKFTYDAFGRRQSRVIAGTDTEYLYDISGNIGAEYVQDGGLPIDAGALLSFDVSTFSPDELVCTYRGGTFDTMVDINGSVLGLVSDGGIIQASYAYEPYGNTTSVGDAGTDQQYTGREDDIPGVLQYNRWRYYNPTIGRFISEDPIGIAGGANLYGYAEMNPVTLRDPTGQQCEVVLDNAEEIIQECITVVQALCAAAATVVTWQVTKKPECPSCYCFDPNKGSQGSTQYKNGVPVGPWTKKDCSATCGPAGFKCN